MLLLFGYPLINSIIMAFQNYKLTAPNDIQFNGLENFAKLFGDPDSMMILKNSFIYVIVSVLGQFLLGMMLALALKKQFRGRGIYQSIVFLPWAFSGFVVGLIFRWSFNGEYGIVNNLLMKFGLTDHNIAWLGTPGFSLAVVIMAMIWMGIPFFAIMILAALQSIPSDVYEAADVRRLRYGTAVFPDHAPVHKADTDYDGSVADDFDLQLPGPGGNYHGRRTCKHLADASGVHVFQGVWVL